jgi:hypothetical protein
MNVMETKRKKIKALTKDDLPGYYAPEDDIMNRAKRVEGNLDDEILNVERTRPVHVPLPVEDVGLAEGTEDKLKPKGKSNLTDEDREALGPKDLSLDMNDDEQLKHRVDPVDFAGTDLDIPGSELDDASEELGSEDEENNNYSLGGDNHEDLEEPRP